MMAMTRRAPPWSFFWLHCAAWPVSVVDLALASTMVSASVPVQQVAGIIAAVSLAYALEIIWAPIVDAAFTRRRWYVAGAGLMCACLAGLLVAPWHASSVPLLTGLAFCASTGSAIALVAAKGIMAYDVPVAQLGRASGFYTAGGTLAKSVAGAGTLWLLTHLSSRALVAGLTVGAAALAMSVIRLSSPGLWMPASALISGLRVALLDAWKLIRTPVGALVAVLCVVPFGSSTVLGAAIAKEWSVSPDQLAASIPIGAVLAMVGAVTAGRLSARFGSWRTYIGAGWIMIGLLAALAYAPRTPSFLSRCGSCTEQPQVPAMRPCSALS
jgi:MFS family permease